MEKNEKWQQEVSMQTKIDEINKEIDFLQQKEIIKTENGYSMYKRLLFLQNIKRNYLKNQMGDA